MCIRDRVDDVEYELKYDHEALKTHVNDVIARRRALENTIADHPWIVGGTPESRTLPRDQLTPLGDPPHGIPLPQHELTPLGEPLHGILEPQTPLEDPLHRIPLSLPPEPMDTSD